MNARPHTQRDAALELTNVRVEHHVRRTRRHRTRQGNGRATIVALDGVSLRVPEGQWLALLGPNGSGKSTLLRLASTLESPSNGSVRVLGADVAPRARLRDTRARLGVVFQEPTLDPLLTIRENLRLALALVGRSDRGAARRIEDVARLTGVDDRLDDRVDRLSGGLARRADLARAIAHEPHLLLLDEPTTALDVQGRRDFLNLLRSLRREAGPTIIMSTHLVEEAALADRLVLLDRGRIVDEGAPEQMREEMGEHVLRAPAAARAILEDAGAALLGEGETLVAAGDPGALEDAAAALTRAGHAFSYAPPTLEDVFLARTGRALTEPQDAPAEQEPVA